MSTGLRFTLEVDGLPPDAFAVVSFHLNQSLTGVLKGSLSEDVFQDRGTIAGSVHVDAVNNGGEGDGIQAYTAIKEILLAVEESKIALTPDGIQLQVGESTVIRLSKDGITIVGGSVFIN